MIFNMISGGGKFATIAATFPSGSTVTCVQDPYSYTVSEGTSYNFVVPKSGTWTLTVTKNGLTKTETVDVTTYGETYNVALHIDYYLFKGGEGAKVTWSYYGGSSVPHHINSDNIYVGVRVESSSIWYGGRYYTPKIDLTQYDSLIVECKASNSIAIQIRNGLGADGSVVRQKISGNTSTHTETIDISNLNSSYSIAIADGNGSNAGGYAYNVFLRA